MKYVNYFNDLTVIAVKSGHFYGTEKWRRTRCEPNRFSLELILTGKVRLYLDNSLLQLEAPCCFWIGDHHRSFLYECMDTAPYEHLWIDFTGPRGRRIYESVCAMFPDQYVKLPPGRGAFIAAFQDGIERFQSNQAWMIPDIVLLMDKLMFELNRIANSRIPHVDDPHGLRLLADMIDKEPFKLCDPNQLATERKLSLVRFRELFKERFGMPFGQYLLKRRMDKSAELLLSGGFRIGELAEYCGFSDITAFSRAFRIYHGISPHDYLKKNKKPGGL